MNIGDMFSAVHSVTLGDIIDRHHESYGDVLPVYDRLRHRSAFALGNHDFEVAADHLGSILRTIGLKRAHYDFSGSGFLGSPVFSHSFEIILLRRYLTRPNLFATRQPHDFDSYRLYKRNL